MKKDTMFYIGTGVLVIAMIALFAMLSNRGNNNNSTITTPTPTGNVSPTPRYTKVPDIFLEDDATYNVKLSTTAGEITIKIDQKAVPVAANNFAFLVKEGFYNGTPFHRTIPRFMIQGGDPTGTGMGGPGYKFADEPFTGEYKRGIVAYANSGPDTNGSQFFIMHADYPLQKDYVIFGEVTEGLDTVDAIANAPTVKTGEGSTPVTPVTITSAVLIKL